MKKWISLFFCFCVAYLNVAPAFPVYCTSPLSTDSSICCCQKLTQKKMSACCDSEQNNPGPNSTTENDCSCAVNNSDGTTSPLFIMPERTRSHEQEKFWATPLFIVSSPQPEKHEGHLRVIDHSPRLYRCSVPFYILRGI